MGSGKSRTTPVGLFIRLGEEEFDYPAGTIVSTVPSTDRYFTDNSLAYDLGGGMTVMEAYSKLSKYGVEIGDSMSDRKFIPAETVLESDNKEVSYYSRIVIDTAVELLDNYWKTDFAKEEKDLMLNTISFSNSYTNVGGYYTQKGIYEDPRTLELSLSMDKVSVKERAHLAIEKGALSMAVGKEWTSDSDNYGYSVVTDPASSVMIHEYGHVIQTTIATSEKYKPLLNKYLRDHVDNDYHLVSTYGALNLAENFAESFALYVRGVSTSSNGNVSYQKFKTLMKNVGLSKMYGTVIPEKIYTKALGITLLRDAVSDYTPTSSIRVAKITRPIETKESAPKNFGTFVIGNKMLISVGGKEYSANVTPARKKRGFMTKTIDGTTYKINTINGKMEIINK